MIVAIFRFFKGLFTGAEYHVYVTGLQPPVTGVVACTTLPPPVRTYMTAPTSTWVIVNPKNAVWAGPWKSDGTTFTKVSSRWYRYLTEVAAQLEIDSNDFLRHCRPEMDS